MSYLQYLLILWDVDNSVSVVRRDAKGVISIKEELITFKWPRKGIYEGKIIDSSGKKQFLSTGYPFLVLERLQEGYGFQGITAH